MLVGPQHLKAQLNGLKALTNYTAEVRALNEFYESPPSFTIIFTTPEGRPSKVSRFWLAQSKMPLLDVWCR